MPNKIKFRLTIQDLALSNYEKQNEIHISVRSTGNRQVGSEQFMETDWEVVGKLSKPKTVTIDLPDKNQPDTRLFVEVFTRIENSVGLPAPVCYGTAQADLIDLVSSLRGSDFKKNIFTIDVPILCIPAPTSKDVIVGKLRIEVLNPDEIKNLMFEPIKAFHILQVNSTRISQALNKYIQREIGFIQSRSPLVPEIENILHPCQKSDVYIPGKYFFTDLTEGRTVKDEEKLFGNLLQTSLNRNNVDVPWFNEKVNSLFKGEIDDKDRMMVSKVFADVCTIFPTSRYYASDRVYIRGQLRDTEDFQESLERFDQISVNSSGDCEDLAKNIFNTLTRLQRTEFISTPLKNLSEFSKLYVACGTLASVQGAQLIDAKGETEIFIGDKNDMKVQKGAHMFVTAIPHAKFVEMVRSGPNSSDADKLATKYYDKRYDPISASLSCLALEGTGSMNPFIFPLQCYTSDQKISCELKELHLKHKKVQSQILKGKDTLYISQGTIQQIPSSDEDKPDKQPKFLRYATQLYTDKFGKPDTFFPSDGHSRGISIRSLFLSDNKQANINEERYYKKPTLEMLERESEDDEKIFVNLKRQLPIYPNQVPDDNYIRTIGTSVSLSGENRVDRLWSFNQKCNDYTKGRISNNYVDLTISYKHDSLFDSGFKNTKLIDGIMEEVRKNNNIISSQAKMIILSDKISVVDIKYRFNA